MIQHDEKTMRAALRQFLNGKWSLCVPPDPRVDPDLILDAAITEAVTSRTTIATLRERVAELERLLAIARSDASFEHSACEVAQSRVRELEAVGGGVLRAVATVARIDSRLLQYVGPPTEIGHALQRLDRALHPVPPAAVEPTPAREGAGELCPAIDAHCRTCVLPEGHDGDEHEGHDGARWRLVPSPTPAAAPGAGERCGVGCPHPPHLGACTGRSGGTAHPCPCIRTTLPTPQREEVDRGD